jgi:hypothetical protein
MTPETLTVDSAGNGVFEPGETVVVVPSWKNTGAAPLAVTGVASSFTGPAGPVYTIADAAADYGSIGAGATVELRGGDGRLLLVRGDGAHDPPITGTRPSRRR